MYFLMCYIIMWFALFTVGVNWWHLDLLLLCVQLGTYCYLQVLLLLVNIQPVIFQSITTHGSNLV